jgi:hypothetical protein
VFDTRTLHPACAVAYAPSHLLRFAYAHNQKDALNKSLNNQPHKPSFSPALPTLNASLFYRKAMRKILLLKIEKEPATRPQSEIEIFYLARLDEKFFCCPFALKRKIYALTLRLRYAFRFAPASPHNKS